MFRHENPGKRFYFPGAKTNARYRPDPVPRALDWGRAPGELTGENPLHM